MLLFFGKVNNFLYIAEVKSNGTFKAWYYSDIEDQWYESAYTGLTYKAIISSGVEVISYDP